MKKRYGVPALIMAILITLSRIYVGVHYPTDIMAGTVIGICIACAGLGGALWAYLGGVVIVAAGWRGAYHVLGLLALAVSLPACLFLLHNHPKDVGVLPYSSHVGDDGREEASRFDPECGVPASVAFRSPTFFLFAVGVSLTASVIDMTNLLPAYVYYLGDAGYLAMSTSQVVMAASTIALCTQIAQGIGKIVLGAFADRSAIELSTAPEHPSIDDSQLALF